MATKIQPRLIRRIPRITLGMVAAALIVFLVPALHSALVYDRSAVLQGELWRLATGAWVHFSVRHFIYDTVALGLAGWMIERRAYANFAWVCVFTPWVAGATSLCLEPDLAICGGLSGLATAALVFLALHGLRDTGAWRWACWLALVATAGKLWLEVSNGRFVFLETGDPSFVPVPSNHIMGGLTAIAVFVWGKALPAQRRAKGQVSTGLLGAREDDADRLSEKPLFLDSVEVRLRTEEQRCTGHGRGSHEAVAE